MCNDLLLQIFVGAFICYKQKCKVASFNLGHPVYYVYSIQSLFNHGNHLHSTTHPKKERVHGIIPQTIQTNASDQCCATLSPIQTYTSTIFRGSSGRLYINRKTQRVVQLKVSQNIFVKTSSNTANFLNYLACILCRNSAMKRSLIKDPTTLNYGIAELESTKNKKPSCC